ncbi:MAG: ATP-binding protein [Candidatus Acidiferrum sp.]|jgi:PAS domain S-box-containing protein
MGFFSQLFSSGGFQPHGFCYAWNPGLVWLHVVSDLVIALAYFAVPLVMLWFFRRRPDIPFSWIFAFFSIFIVACGATHVMEIWNLWHAQYWIAGAVKAITATASIGTAAVLMLTAPKLLEVPNLTDWAKADADLELHVKQRNLELPLANDELQESRETLRLAHRAGKIGSWDRNIATGDTTWSPELEELYGITDNVGQYSSEFWLSFVHPDDVPAIKAALARSFQAASPYAVDFRITRRDGQRRWLSARANVVTDASGRPNRLVGITLDITELKLAAEKIRALNASLEARINERTKELLSANKELESFSYSVSHDLRAPLRTIDGFSMALLEDCGGQLDETCQGHLQRIRSAAQRMGTLIDDLLHLSRVTRTQLNAQAFDLSAMVANVVNKLRATQPERSAACKIQPALFATADAQLLRVAIENLINNAWKFTSKRSDSLIEFGTTQKDGEDAFFVRDNGAGFDPANAGRLFGAFQRLHGPAEFPGTGVGLATVQRVIHRHGGRIWAESSLDHGATFFFTLPQSNSQEGSSETQADLVGGRQSR